MPEALPKTRQAEARALLTKAPYAAPRAQAERQKRAFQTWATKKAVAAATRRLEEDWERLITFYAFQRSTGNTCGRRTWWGRPSRRHGCVRRPPGDSRRWRRDRRHLEDPARRGAQLPAVRRARAAPRVAEDVIYSNGVREKQGNVKAAA